MNRSLLVTCQDFILIIFNIDTTSMEPVFAYFTFNPFLIHLHWGTTFLTLFAFITTFSAYSFEFLRPCADAMINQIRKKCVSRILTVTARPCLVKDYISFSFLHWSIGVYVVIWYQVFKMVHKYYDVCVLRKNLILILSALLGEININCRKVQAIVT